MKQNVQHVGSRLTEMTSKDFCWYITGFVDGEGCFSISFSKREKMKSGIEVKPSFSIGQHRNSLMILNRIHEYFGCGSIRFSKYDQTYKYEVRSITDLRKRIIPHFNKFPLLTKKLEDFVTFSSICEEIAASKHLNKDNLISIIERAYTMNQAGKRKYTKQELLKMIESR